MYIGSRLNFDVFISQQRSCKCSGDAKLFKKRWSFLLPLQQIAFCYRCLMETLWSCSRYLQISKTRTMLPKAWDYSPTLLQIQEYTLNFQDLVRKGQEIEIMQGIANHFEIIACLYHSQIAFCDGRLFPHRRKGCDWNLLQFIEENRFHNILFGSAHSKLDWSLYLLIFHDCCHGVESRVMNVKYHRYLIYGTRLLDDLIVQ